MMMMTMMMMMMMMTIITMNTIIIIGIIATMTTTTKNIDENARPVGPDNIGNKMLHCMGWGGGGLGAKGQGIAEPISQQIKFSRSGLC